MDSLIFFIVIASIYLVMLFFDMFFKSCMHYPYNAFMHNTGFKLQLFRINWYTNAFNRAIFRWGTSWNKILTQSFSIGVIITLILIPFSILLIIITLFSNSTADNLSESKSTAGKFSGPHLEILLPGFNLPFDEIGYYICTLLVSSVVHEMGHALAAIIEDVPVTGFGIQFYFCLPIAYTEISTEHLLGLKCFKKLRVLCGGIWHNIILALICYLIYSTLGLLVTPFYRINEGLIITEIYKNSPLLGERGLNQNDIIFQINNCQTFDMDSWYDCLIKPIRNKPGYCVTSDFIRLNDESRLVSHGDDDVIQCCDPANLKLCCFEYIDDLNNDNPVEIPQHVCLDIRRTIEDSSGYCTINCAEHGGFCIKPLLRNTTTIFTFKRQNNLKSVIYLGHPRDIIKTIKVSSFIPKISIFSPKLGDSTLLFLKYNVLFSFGLAMINSLPCFGLDGYYISGTIIHNMLMTSVSERAKREMIITIATSLGTLLFVCSVFKTIWISTFKIFF